MVWPLFSFSGNFGEQVAQRGGIKGSPPRFAWMKRCFAPAEEVVLPRGCPEMKPSRLDRDFLLAKVSGKTCLMLSQKSINVDG